MGKQAGAKGEEEKTVFEKAMKEDSSSADLMDEWEKVNPAHQKWAKKGMIDWCRFEQRFGTNRSKGSRGKKRTMDKLEFAAFGKYKKGWDKELIIEEWTKIEDELEILDHRGHQGGKRYEVDCGRYSYDDKASYWDNAGIQGSDNKKRVTKDDTDALRNLALKSVPVQGDAFLAGKWNEDAEAETTPRKKPRVDDPEPTPEEEDDTVDVNVVTKQYELLVESWQGAKTYLSL